MQNDKIINEGESENQKIKRMFSYFNNHEIEIIHETEKVKRYKCSKPNSWTYGFYLTCADNLIVMNGDCYSLLIEPGYGRDGLAFLRGSVNSYGYFLSKCPMGMEIREYSPDYALELIKEYCRDVMGDADLEDNLPYGLDDSSIWGEVSYWDFCNDNNIDDPCSPRVYTGTTLLQIAGLQKFVELYEKSNGIFK